VENRVFLLRAANTGISAVIDPLGRVLQKTEIFTEDVLTADVSINNEMRTFYTIYGDVFAYICFFFSGVFIIGALRKVRK